MILYPPPKKLLRTKNGKHLVSIPPTMPPKKVPGQRKTRYPKKSSENFLQGMKLTHPVPLLCSHDFVKIVLNGASG